VAESERKLDQHAKALVVARRRVEEAEARAAAMDALADRLAAIIVEREREAERLRAELREAGVGAFEGTVHLDIGPLSDFSTLAGLEDAIDAIDGVESVTIKRFSAGRATLAVRMGSPVELLPELQRVSNLELSVRKASKSHVVLDVPEHGAAAA
jgi:hypothetical protein